MTEVAPAEVSDVGAVSGAYQAGGRFTAFYRLGGGMQYVKDKNGNCTHVYTNGRISCWGNRQRAELL
ncbi:protease IgA1 [Escherichia coli]|nr:protease IgA1 [Escherichia coli]